MRATDVLLPILIFLKSNLFLAPISRWLAGQRAVRRPYHIAAALIFSIVALGVFWPYLRMMPEGFHVWPQADRLSLAINFYDSGFNFWYPRTSGFSGAEFTSIGGVTGVEFPIQAYLAGLSGLLFGRAGILPAFRVLDIAMMVLGFWYLFRLVFERTGSFAAGLLPGFFLLAAPTFAFYAGSTLPDPFSLSLTFVGYYYWLRYFEAPGRFGDLPLAFAILSLAALIKTTSALHLGAVAGITFLYSYFEPQRFSTRQRLVLVVVLGAGMSSIVGFYLHNQWLNTTYQATQFLSTTMPVVPVVTWHVLVMRFFDLWRYEYFTPPEYVVLGCSVVLCVVLLHRGWGKFRPLLLLLLASLAISYLFYCLMGPQIIIHDYYIICSFMPPVLLAIVLALLLLTTALHGPRFRQALSGSLLLLSAYLAYSSVATQAGRMSDYHPPASNGYTHRWMRGGAAVLARAGVPAQARVLILGDWAPNTALVFFDRRGVTWLPYMPELTVANLEKRMSADSLQYVIMQREAYAQLAAPQQAALAEAFAPVVRQAVTVWRRRHPKRTAW